MTIREKVRAYHGSMGDEHHRYRSWEHCYGYFHGLTPRAIAADRHHAALQLGFYLASWGMYRGSGFLLQNAYTVHLAVIDQLIAKRFRVLWNHDFGADENDIKLVPAILDAIEAIRDAYRPFAAAALSPGASDTLVSKVLLGSLGCLPACDRYFIAGFKHSGFKYSELNGRFVERILGFCLEHVRSLQTEQKRIKAQSGSHYPLMKLVDMYFWQIGYELR